MNPGLALGGGLLALMVGLVAGLAPTRLLAVTTPVGRSGWSGWSVRLSPRVLSVATCVTGLSVYGLLLPRAGWDAALAAGAGGACLAGVFLIDLDRLLIPDLYPAALAALALVGPLAPPLADAALGAVVGGGLVWAVRAAVSRLRGVEAMGFGDVKLTAAVGALLGPEPVLWAVCGGALIGAAWGWSRGRLRPDRVPLAPFGAALALPALGLLLWRTLAP